MGKLHDNFYSRNERKVTDICKQCHDELRKEFVAEMEEFVLPLSSTELNAQGKRKHNFFASKVAIVFHFFSVPCCTGCNSCVRNS